MSIGPRRAEALELHLTPGDGDVVGALRPPGDPAVPVRPVVLPVASAEPGPSGLASALREAVRHSAARLLLLTGPLDLQIRCLPVLRHLAPKARLVCCVMNADRPLLLPPGARACPVDALVLAAAPQAVELADWRRCIGQNIEERVYTLPDDRVPGRRVTDAPAEVARSWTLALLAQRSDPWMALGLQAFQLWSQGRYGRCGVCTAITPDRLQVESGGFREATRCDGCGGHLRRADAQPAARLRLELAERRDEAPDPWVLAEWLGLSAQMSVTAPMAAGAEEPAGAVMLLADPAFPNPWFARAMARSARVISNDPRAATSDTVIAVPGRHCSWDPRGWMSTYPGLDELLRALDQAFTQGPVTVCSDRPGAEAAQAKMDEAWAQTMRSLLALTSRRPPLWRARYR